MAMFWLYALTPVFPQQKLVYKDGTTEIVERYEVKGDRVRFKSLERNEWEEVPLDLVDLEATRKVNEKEPQEVRPRHDKAPDASKNDSANQAPNTPRTLQDVEVAPGVKLPDAYGLFVWDGKKLVQLAESGTRKKDDRKKTIINMVAPAPILKQKYTIQLDGPTSDIQIQITSPVIYIHLPGDRGGDLSLFHMMVTKSARILKEVSHSQITGGDSEKSQEYIVTPSFRIADEVYKMSPAKPLPVGEYYILELAESQNRLTPTVWDFSIAR